MKKLTLFIIGFLLSVSMFAQEDKLSIGILASPDYYLYDFNSIQGFDHQYESKLNYTLGLSFRYNLSTRFQLKTGAAYSTKGFRLVYNWQMANPGDPLAPEQSNINLGYINIPVSLSYRFLNSDKIILSAGAGVVTDILINEKETVHFSNGSKHNSDLLFQLHPNNERKSTLFSINFDLGLQYKITEKLSASLSPYFRYGLTKVDEELESNPMSVGAQVEVIYVIK